MRRRGLVVLTMVIMGSLVVPARAAPPEQVSIHDRTYDPSFLVVPAGTNVRWTNDERGGLLGSGPSHTVTADDGSFGSGTISPGGSYKVRFATVGTVTYHCEIHSTMRGTIVVSRGTTSSATASATPTPTKSTSPSPSPTKSRSRRPSPNPSASSTVVAQAAAPQNDDSSAGTIISVAIIVISVLIGLGYVVYLRYLRRPT